MAERLTTRHAHALLHLTVLLWGATALLGKSIHIAALPLVFYRVAVVSVLAAGLMVWKGIPFALGKTRALELGGAGILVALHWVLFYAAVKEAGVSSAVLCLSTMTFFTALLEPLLFYRRPRLHELVLGGLVIVGVVLLLRFEAHASVKGYIMGITSAFFSAAFGTWNGLLTTRETPERVTFFELTAATAACAAAFPLVGGFVPPSRVSAHDWLLLSALAVLCTLFPWLWSLRILRTLSPYTVAITIALEPVYSIAFAYVLWPSDERLAPRFYVGAALLLAAVFSNGALTRRTRSALFAAER